MGFVVDEVDNNLGRMQINMAPNNLNMNTDTAHSSQQSSSRMITDESEPEPVLVGSEEWHSHFPNEWLPVIQRDISRQRRQNSQPPFSDAYLSGMSSKRRKLIAKTKPSNNVPELVSDGVRHAVQTAGLTNNGTTSLDEVAASISNDPVVQGTYREAMRETIRERLRNDPDFDASRYPNISKYFEPGK